MPLPVNGIGQLRIRRIRGTVYLTTQFKYTVPRITPDILLIRRSHVTLKEEGDYYGCDG
jgi:hypothetical protein